MDSILNSLDPAIAAKVIAVLVVLSAIKGLLGAFGNQENVIVKWLGKILDIIGYNPPHAK
jgi:hypothetical protein